MAGMLSETERIQNMARKAGLPQGIVELIGVESRIWPMVRFLNEHLACSPDVFEAAAVEVPDPEADITSYLVAVGCLVHQSKVEASYIMISGMP